MRWVVLPCFILLIGAESSAAVTSAPKQRVRTAPAAGSVAPATPAEPAAVPPAAKEPRCEVAIVIDNVRKNGDRYLGQVCYTVFNSKDGFPDNSERAYLNQCVPVQQSPTLSFTLKDLPCNQDYGMALLHDENMNRQLDKNLAIPKEGIGMSNNPSFLRVNSPSFDEVKFAVKAPHSAQKIHIHYF